MSASGGDRRAAHPAPPASRPPDAAGGLSPSPQVENAPTPRTPDGPLDAGGPSGVPAGTGGGDPGPVGPAGGLGAGPYLRATALAVSTLAVLIVVAGVPVAATLQVGLTYLAVALGARRLEDLPPDAGGRVVQWVAERLRRLEDDFGVEFYGLASLTAFLRAQVISLSETEISLSGLLENPIVSLVTWLISELIESVVNMVWATLWWLQLLRAVPGVGWFVAVVAAGWAVWRLLDVEPPGGTDPAVAEGPGPAALAGDGPATDRPTEPRGAPRRPEGEG